MKNILLFFISFASLAQSTQNLVLLDLSDRLLVNGQSQKDKAVIMADFAKFEAKARRAFFVKCTDSFEIYIAPQKGGVQTEDFAAHLKLDFGTMDMQDRFRSFEKFKKALPSTLDKIYAKARVGKAKAADFSGSDIWRFFNDDLPFIKKKDVHTHLTILTDGYFDFEQNATVLREGNRYTDSRMLNDLRKDPNGLKTLKKPTEGLIPVRKSFRNMAVTVEQINPKYPNLSEQDLLMGLWKKWLAEMHINQVAVRPS